MLEWREYCAVRAGDFRLNGLGDVLKELFNRGYRPMFGGFWAGRPAREQLPLFADARFVVTAYGPQMALLPLARPGTAIVELVPAGA